MKTIHLFLLWVFLIPFNQLFGQANHNALSGLATIKDNVKSKRVSSYDQSGGNGDFLANIQDGESRTLFDVEGAGVINHIWITIAPPPNKLSRNDIILKMYWDGNEFPSVVSPIGPFFGQGWEESYSYSSLPLAVGPKDGRSLVSYFQMPFADGAKIEIVNETGKAIDRFYYYVDYMEVESLEEDMGRFHAWYNHELTNAHPEGEDIWGTLNVGGGKNPTGEKNYLIADIKGQGHYIGVNYYVHSPVTMWYGEGDDMFYIDGEEKPSIHGTGTEDYFNTSWCPKTAYSHPYFGYPRVNNNIGWLGRTHVYRFHITDPVYFEESLKFSIEHGHNNRVTLDLSSVAYWYAKPPLSELPPIPDKAARKPKPQIDFRDIHRWRHEWRKNMGNDPNLWGDEKKSDM